MHARTKDLLKTSVEVSTWWISVFYRQIKRHKVTVNWRLNIEFCMRFYDVLPSILSQNAMQYNVKRTTKHRKTHHNSSLNVMRNEEKSSPDFTDE